MLVHKSDLIGAVDQALAPGEAIGEIFQICWRCHSHSIAQAAHLDGDRYLFCDRPVLNGRSALGAAACERVLDLCHRRVPAEIAELLRPIVTRGSEENTPEAQYPMRNPYDDVCL